MSNSIPEMASYSPTDISRLNDFINFLSLLELNYDMDTSKKILHPILQYMDSHPSVKSLLLASATSVKLHNVSVRERELEMREKNLDLRLQILAIKEENLALKEDNCKLKEQVSAKKNHN